MKVRKEITPEQILHCFLGNINKTEICFIGKNNHISGTISNYITGRSIKIQPQSHILCVLCNTPNIHDLSKCTYISNNNKERILALYITNSSHRKIKIQHGMLLRYIIYQKNVQYVPLTVKVKNVKYKRIFTISPDISFYQIN